MIRRWKVVIPVFAWAVVAVYIGWHLAASLDREHVDRARARVTADCTKWLDKAAQYTNAGLDTNPELSSAYSLLAIANGCNR